LKHIPISLEILFFLSRMSKNDIFSGDLRNSWHICLFSIWRPKQMVVQNFAIDSSHLLVQIIRIIFICDICDLEWNSFALIRAEDRDANI
jgi:hypothetical protein